MLQPGSGAFPCCIRPQVPPELLQPRSIAFTNGDLDASHVSSPCRIRMPQKQEGPTGNPQSSLPRTSRPARRSWRHGDSTLTYVKYTRQACWDAFVAHCWRRFYVPGSMAGEPHSWGNAARSLPICTMPRGRVGRARKIEDGGNSTPRDLYPVRGYGSERLKLAPFGEYRRSAVSSSGSQNQRTAESTPDQGYPALVSAC